MAVDVAGWAGRRRVTQIAVAVRGEGTEDAGRLPFQVDDVGWTAR